MKKVIALTLLLSMGVILIKSNLLVGSVDHGSHCDLYIRLDLHMPPGSYKESCDCVFDIKTDTLSCNCCDASGDESQTTLNSVSQCKDGISNCNGVLKCGNCR